MVVEKSNTLWLPVEGDLVTFRYFSADHCTHWKSARAIGLLKDQQAQKTFFLHPNCIADSMAGWATLPYEIRYQILSFFSETIIKEYRYFQKYPHDYERLYGTITVTDGH
jgi:hypothetical protein